ncbi:MAG: hypothetical protein GF308_17095 [Candidatus Heimdallarchaeota archaeon]|nr:hypothetical protein [Candidatus Heimdallarchaeota archaeon]
MDLIECSKLRLDKASQSSILPDKIRKDLLSKGNNFVLVYTKKSQTLRFFPISQDNVWWLKISINSFSPETSGEILAKLSKLVTEFVYSTGICLSKSKCFWDGVILNSAFVKSREEIIRELKEVPNVVEVSLREIK